MQRFTISLDDDLATAFDAWVAARGYANRSEAVRDLLRAELQSADLRDGTAAHCVACLSYVYNHHQRDLAERVTHLQHEHHQLTVSTMHAHLDHDHCLETVILRGPTPDVRQFADVLRAERGVHHGQLNVIAVDLHGAAHRHGAAPDGAQHHHPAAAAPAGHAAHPHAHGGTHPHPHPPDHAHGHHPLQARTHAHEAGPEEGAALLPHVHLKPSR